MILVDVRERGDSIVMSNCACLPFHKTPLTIGIMEK